MLNWIGTTLVCTSGKWSLLPGGRTGWPPGRCRGHAPFGYGLARTVLPQPIFVAPHEFLNPAVAVEHQRAGDHVVEEHAIVAHEQQRPGPFQQL